MDEYKVIRPFSILDIYKFRRTGEYRKIEFDIEFENLLREQCDRAVDYHWIWFKDNHATAESIFYSKVLMRNLPWLEKQDWIEREHEYPWVNIFVDGTTSLNYSTKQRALEGSSLSKTKYVTTVQLKPQTL